MTGLRTSTKREARREESSRIHLGVAMTDAGVVRLVVLRAWVLALAVVVLSAITVPSVMAATATPAYEWDNSYFGSAGGGSQGLAIEPGTGNVAAADAPSGVVQLSNSSGASVTTIATGGAPNGIAFDQTSGALYVGDAAGNSLKRYLTDGAPTPTFTVDPSFASPSQGAGAGQIGSFASRIAVDPANHDVLVADTGNQRVSRYTSAGVFVQSIDGSTTTGGAFTALKDVAVGPGGATYIVDDTRVETFSSAGVSQGPLPLTGVPIAVTVDTVTGVVHVVSSGPDTGDNGGPLPQFEGFTAAGVPYYAPQHFPTWSDCCPAVSVAIDVSTKKLFSQVTFTGVLSFPMSIIPGIDPPVVSQIGTRSIHVSADVDLGAGPPAGSAARFEYSSDGGATWVLTPNVQPTVSPMEADITGLDADVDYLVRAVALNSQRTATTTAVAFHTTMGPPSADTGAATDIGDDSAVIYGSVNPFGQQSTYHFEYGTTTAYGSQAPVAAELSAGSGRAPHTYYRNISGLEPGTTYHYRIVARSSQGTVNGADATFKTEAHEDVVRSARAYEQVTPVDKDGGSISVGYGMSSSPDGSALVFTGSSPLGDSALTRPLPSAPINPYYVSRRDSNGWGTPTAFDVPIDLVRSYLWVTTLGVAEDSVHALVATNRKLADGAIAGQANLYVSDARTGSYTYVGGSSAPGALAGFVGQLTSFTRFEAGASDFSWVAFYSDVPLLPGVSGAALYHWSAAEGLQLASVMPDGNPPTGDVVLRIGLGPSVRKVSDDGKTTYFAILGGGQDGVYVRHGGQTKAISVSQVPGDPATPHFGVVVGTSRDGRYGFFANADGVPLTAGAAAGLGDLYRYDNATGDLQYLGGSLRKPTANDVYSQSYLVPFVSDDGDTVAFYDAVALLPGAPSDPSYRNLYVWHDGSLQLLKGSQDPGTDISVVRGSPNGRYVAARVRDDAETLSGSAHPLQVYLLDTVTGTTRCVSCPTNGKPSVGDSSLANFDTALVTREPRGVTDRGQVFFTSSSRLEAADGNGRQDVYMFQDGKRTLISPGDQEFSARLVEVSESGDDVFFSTTQSLVGQDTDRGVDIYDARVGGGFAAQSPLSEDAPCVGVGCAEPGTGPVSSSGAGSQASPSPSTPGKTNQKRVKVTVPRVTFTATAMHVSVRATGQGRARLTGSRVRTTIRQLASAGTYTVIVPLSAKARSLKHAHRRFKVTAKVTLTPAWGTASTAKISRTLGK